MVCVLTLLDDNAIGTKHGRVKFRLQIMITAVEGKRHAGIWLHNSGHKHSR